MLEVRDVAISRLEIREAEPVMVYDLATIINTVYQQNVEPTQARRIPKRVINKLRPQLKGMPRYSYEGDDYADMLFTLLVQMRVLQVSAPPFPDMKPRLEPGPAMTTWASLELEQQMGMLLKAWLETLTLFDVLGTEYESWSASWSSSLYYYSRDTLKGRRALLQQLQSCTPGKWYSVTSLLESIWQEQPLALYSLSKSAQKTELRKIREARERWMASDGQFYVGMLMSSLAEIGLLAQGFEPATAKPSTMTDDQDDEDNTHTYVNPDLFMLTEQGAALLPIVLTQEPFSVAPKDDPARMLIVQPDFELFLLQPHLPTLYCVLPFTQVRQIGAASRLTLTKASILRGIAAGKKIETIIQTLAEHSEKELPQNVVYALRDWARLYKEVRVTPVVLLETPNEAIATQLCASAKLRSFGVRQLAPTILAVDGATNLQELRTALEKEQVTLHVAGFQPQRG